MNANPYFQPGVSELSSPQFGHAVVIGSGIAGLLAARVLINYFDRVTIVERDNPPNPIEFRRGVPQTRHAHRLLPRGQAILEQQFPGLVNELLFHGAVAVDASEDITVDYEGKWQSGHSRSNWVSLSASRALLESTIYRRLTAFSGIDFMQGYGVLGLQVDDSHERVTGIWLQCNRCQSQIELSADLVVDVSGRSSKSPQWLAALGFSPPEEWVIDSFVGYSTRIYERPATVDGNWKMLYIRPTPPDGTRGGIIVPMEGNRWHVTLIGVAGDYPQHDEAGFLEFTRSLPVPELYEAIRDAKPLTKPTGFQLTASRVRRYDSLPRYLEGFVVYGDAAYILNPMYAQGMTAAAIGSQTLDQCLAQQPQGNLTGLASAFQKQLSLSLGRLWHMVTSQDWHWPTTTITDNSDQLYRN